MTTTVSRILRQVGLNTRHCHNVKHYAFQGDPVRRYTSKHKGALDTMTRNPSRQLVPPNHRFLQGISGSLECDLWLELAASSDLMMMGYWIHTPLARHDSVPLELPLWTSRHI